METEKSNKKNSSRNNNKKITKMVKKKGLKNNSFSKPPKIYFSFSLIAFAMSLTHFGLLNLPNLEFVVFVISRSNLDNFCRSRPWVLYYICHILHNMYVNRYHE